MSAIAATAAASGRPQSPGEELANSLSHGLGALASLVALPILIRGALRSGPAAAWPYAVFGLSLLLLFTASTAYHAARGAEAKRRLRVLDHSSIYVLIAGSYTAYSLCYLGGFKGWILFGAEWAIAAGGMALSARGGKFRTAGALVYIAMGWLAAPFFGEIRAALPPASFSLLAAGGLAYTAGVAFYAIKRVPYFHALWHLFVLAGAACHVASLLIAAR